MGAVKVIRYLRDLYDVNTTGAIIGDALTFNGTLWVPVAGGGGGGPPTGPAGGVLSGIYPNPGFAADMATQVELDAHINDPTGAHAGSAISNIPAGTIASTDVQSALNELDGQIGTSLLDAVIINPASSARNVIVPTAGTVIDLIIKAHAAQSVNLLEYQTSAGTPVGYVTKDGAVRIAPSDFPVAALTVVSETNAPDFSRIVEFQDISGNPRFYFEFYPSSTGSADTYMSMSHGDGGPVGQFSQIDFGFHRKDDFTGARTSFALTHQAVTDTVGFFAIYSYNNLGLPAYPFAIDWGSGAISMGRPGYPSQVDPGSAVLVTTWAAARIPLIVRGFAAQTADLQQWQNSAGAVLARLTAAGAFVPTVDIALADGGTGASLADPGADRIMFWDDSGSTVDWLTVGTGLAITGTTIDATASGAPSTATYITQTADAGLSSEQALSALATGLVKNTTGTGVLSIGAAGTDYYAPGGTDVALADGGTGASTAPLARVNLQAATRRTSGYVVGQYYYGEALAAGGLGGVGAQTVGRVFYVPFIVDVTTTFDRIACYITVNGGAGALQRMGIYNDNNGVPGTVLLDAGTVATDAGAASIKAITISQQLTPGIYWLATVGQTASATMRRSIPLGTMQWLSSDFNGSAIILDGVTGALGNNPAAVAVAANPTTCALRALSSP